MPALLKHQQALATVGTSTNIMDKNAIYGRGWSRLQNAVCFNFAAVIDAIGHGD